MLSKSRHAITGQHVLGQDVDLENATPFLALDGVYDEYEGGNWHSHIKLEGAIVGADCHATLIGWVQPYLHEVRVMQIVCTVYLDAAPIVHAGVGALDAAKLVRLAALWVCWLRTS